MSGPRRLVSQSHSGTGGKRVDKSMIQWDPFGVGETRSQRSRRQTVHNTCGGVLGRGTVRDL